MLELIVVVGLLVMTVLAFWKKGAAAGLLMGLAFVLHAAGAFMKEPDDDSFPLSLVLKGLGVLVLFITLLKFYSRRGGAVNPAA